MPPKSAAKGSPTSTSKCRRSKRLSSRIKLAVKEKSEYSIKETPTTSKKERPATSKKERPTTTKKILQDASTNGQPESSKKRPSVTTHKNPRKKRRIMGMIEVNERASQMGLEEQEDFSTDIKQLLEELSPDLRITKEALADMNIYLNNVFERLARQSAIFPLGRSSVSMCVTDVEKAVTTVVEGDLSKYCIAEGRSAVKKWNLKEYEQAYKKSVS